jgi:hypothetical protein
MPKRPTNWAPQRRDREALGVAISVNAGAALVYATRTLDAFDAASSA